MYILNIIKSQENKGMFYDFLYFHSNFDIQAQINLNQSRVEEITMKEDLISNNFITDDNFFGDTPFGETNEKEILRAGSALDESVYKESDVSKITIDEEKDDAIERASVSKSTLGNNFYFD